MRSVTHSLPALLGFFFLFLFSISRPFFASCCQLLARLLREQIPSAFGGNCPCGSIGRDLEVKFRGFQNLEGSGLVAAAPPRDTGMLQQGPGSPCAHLGFGKSPFQEQLGGVLGVGIIFGRRKGSFGLAPWQEVFHRLRFPWMDPGKAGAAWDDSQGRIPRCDGEAAQTQCWNGQIW